jgi:Transposase domain (DUF772).
MVTEMNNEQMVKNQNNPLYNILIPQINFFRILNESVDFSFITDEILQNYSETTGRPAVPPELLFRLILLKIAYKLSDRDLIKRLRTDMEYKYFAGYAPEDIEFVDPSLLSKFRTARLKDCSLLDKLVSKTVEIAIEKGVLNKKAKIIVDSTHTNALYQHVSPREELIKRAKELRKSVYAVDPEMKEKMPKKREASGMLEDEIEYCNELVNIVKSEEEKFTVYADVQERMNYLLEGMEEVKTELEFSKEQDARVGHKTADTSFFGCKTHVAMTPERIITAATVTTGEKHDGKQLPDLIAKQKKQDLKSRQ